MRHNPKNIIRDAAATPGSELHALMAEWQALQLEIEYLSRSENLQSDPVDLIDNDHKEASIQARQNEILRGIIQLPCHSTSEVIEKIKFWQRNKLLGSQSYEEFSLTDQIALSINLDDRPLDKSE